MKQGSDHEALLTMLPEAARTRLSTLSRAAVGAAVGFGAVGVALGRERFAFAYLAAFVFAVTIGLGALFFILIQHLTHAGWSVAARRHMEWIAQILPWSAILFLPVAFSARRIFPWMGEEAHESPILRGKAAYLNPTFFFVRAALYFAVWAGLSLYFRHESCAQDKDGDPAHTERMQRYAPPAMVLFALTTTFAGFDWLMSLQPEWYSTIFGVYVFAGSVTSSLAALALVTIGLQSYGLSERVSNVEHRHEIGKLLFAFTVFWAYIAFSQYFLIWYANIPEETIFYRARWGEHWEVMSLGLGLVHFVIPFLVLLPRAAKRSARALAAVSALVLVAHAVDLFWLVIPAVDPERPPFELADLAALGVAVSALVAVIGRGLAKGPLFPTRDPRLAESGALVNL